MELMGIVGVLVNCALIGLSGQVQRMFPNITSTQTILFIIILEVLPIYCNIAYFRQLVDDIPILFFSACHASAQILDRFCHSGHSFLGGHRNGKNRMEKTGD